MNKPLAQCIMRFLTVSITSLVVSLVITPWLIEPLMVLLNIGANLRGYGHSLGSARWIGWLAWSWLGWQLWEHRKTHPLSAFFRWLLGGTLLAGIGILMLLAIDRHLWEPENSQTRLVWRGYPDVYRIPLFEQLCYIADRAVRLIGLRLISGSLGWQWNYGSPLFHLLEWFWLGVVAWLLSGFSRVASRWLGQRWRFLQDEVVRRYTVWQGWLVIYLSVPLVELASHGLAPALWRLSWLTVYNGAIFVLFWGISAWSAHRLIQSQS